MGTAPKDATEHTRRANAPVELGFDLADFDRASRGLVAQHPTGAISTPHGVVWDVNRHDFIEPGSPNPDTVHPSLWRQAQLNRFHGLFEVAPGIWQARGYDISNVTFIAGPPAGSSSTRSPPSPPSGPAGSWPTPTSAPGR